MRESWIGYAKKKKHAPWHIVKHIFIVTKHLTVRLTFFSLIYPATRLHSRGHWRRHWTTRQSGIFLKKCWVLFDYLFSCWYLDYQHDGTYNISFVRNCILRKKKKKSFSRVFMCKLSCTHLKSALSTDTTWVMNTWEDLDRETFTSKNTFAQYLK